MTRKRWVRLLACMAVASILLGSPVLPAVAHAAPAIIIVVNDGGLGSDPLPCAPGTWTLRCAIVYANYNANTWIRFAPNVPAVLLQSALPTITGSGTWIDGSDGTGVYVGPRIDGIFMTAGNGLTINASYVTISNMKIVNIPSDGEDISILGGKDIEISYDYLGILPGATQCNGLSSGVGVGVAADRQGSANNFNGTAYIIANTISCHRGSGVEIVNSNYVYVGVTRDGLYGNQYVNNIGTTANGTRAAGNGYAGVRVAVNSDQITIRGNRIAYNATGGVTADGTNITVAYNTLSGNYWGLALGGGSAQQIIGNQIGTSADGLLPLPNTHEGILISGGSGLFLSDNLVAYNGAAGIAVTGGTTHAAIQNNEFHNNGGLPIDLGNDGATLNGSHGSSGPNNWLAYPVVTSFSGSIVLGTTCPSCSVFIFKALGNPAAPGGGAAYQTNVLANSFGIWSASLPNGLTRLDVSFIAIDPGGNTSELSPRPQILLPLVRR